MKHILAIFTALFFMASCSDSSESCTEVVTDVPFVIEQGSLICLPGGEQLEFVEITNELCPCGVVCASPGAIRYSLDVTLGDGRVVDGEISAINDLRDIGIDIDGESLPYEFGLAEFNYVEECNLANGSPDILNTTFVLR